MTSTTINTDLSQNLTGERNNIGGDVANLIGASITRAQQIEYCATGTGFMGSSLDYLKNIHRQFAALGIHDDEVFELLRETEAYLDSRSMPPI